MIEYLILHSVAFLAGVFLGICSVKYRRKQKPIECEHISDGLKWVSHHGYVCKCLKCGEFYK